MFFGDPALFAIEIGELDVDEGWVFCQFRFWVRGITLGDWNDRIPLHASVEYMARFCEYEESRLRPEFSHLTAGDVFHQLHTCYFDADPRTASDVQLWAREWHHMDDIGMSAVLDKYGIVLVTVNNRDARLVWKQWDDAETIEECLLPAGEVERVGRDYVQWGRSRLTS